VAQFNEANQAESREIDVNLLDEKHNKLGTSQRAEVSGVPEALLQQKCCSTSAGDRGSSLKERYPNQKQAFTC
jgi:hypothetical protein